MQSKLFFVLPLVLFAACSAVYAQRPAEPSPAASPSPSATPAESDVLAPFKGRHAWLIGNTGIGAAKIGMPVAVLKHKLGDKLVMENVSGVVGDFDAIRIGLDGEVLFYLLHVPDFVPDKVGDIMTNNPKFSTEEGLKPGMTLEEAEKICGKAVLYYSDNNEEDEFATFENQPFPNVRIRPRGVNQGKAGVYDLKVPIAAEPGAPIGNASMEPEGVEGQVHSTDKFQPGAIIESITVTSGGD